MTLILEVLKSAKQKRSDWDSIYKDMLKNNSYTIAITKPYKISCNNCLGYDETCWTDGQVIRKLVWLWSLFSGLLVMRNVQQLVV